MTTHVPKIQPKTAKVAVSKKISQSELQRQQERELKNREKKDKQQQDIAPKITPVKKATISAQDILNKVKCAEQLKQEEYEKRKRCQEEKLQQEALEAIKLEQIKLSQEQIKQELKQKEIERAQRKQQKLCQKIEPPLHSDIITNEQSENQFDEFLFLLTADQREKSAEQKRERDRIKIISKNAELLKQQQEQEQQNIDKKIINENENSWGGDYDEDLDVFGDDGSVIITNINQEMEQNQVIDTQQLTSQVSQKAKQQTNKHQRSPVICVIGHVKTGKTSILDMIRSTNVQLHEDGGITKQIGASYITKQFIKDKTVKFPYKFKINVPGILLIDTPGHESLISARTRGSSLADIAILVVDIMSGVELQTYEAINILRARNTPFIVALNKVDRVHNWKTQLDKNTRQSIQNQNIDTFNDFQLKYTQFTNKLCELGLLSDLWWKVSDINKIIPIIPTSAFTGEGICDLLALLVKFSQIQMENKKQYKNNVTRCTVLGVKKTIGQYSIYSNWTSYTIICQKYTIINKKRTSRNGSYIRV
ncbi:Translation_initiation factor IF-2 [Hexamita inflata]|uniref:Putative n=1 Tax=Hexamita inflata TaxID=28002 RepID=A0ABP1K3I0_9EUKA